MTRKFRIFFVLCVMFALVSQTAFAKDGLFGVGARFAWENYKTPILLHPADHDTGVDVSDFHRSHFGGDFKVRPIDRLSISLSLDLNYYKYAIRPYVDGTEPTVSATYLSFGFLLGVKFYVFEPTPKKATLYLELSGGKYVAKATNNASNQIGNEVLAYQLSMLGDLSAPMVLQFAVGAEFFANKAFSVGADILGLRLTYAKGTTGVTDPALATWSGDQKLMTFSFYTALTLNFGFYKGDKGKGGASEAESEEGWGDKKEGKGGSEADGWGDSGGNSGAASKDDGWGNGNGNGGNDGWGDSGSSDDDGWVAQPPPPEDNNSGGGNSGGGKPKAKAKSSGGNSGGGSSGGGSSPPPPPPPGY